MTRVPPLLYQGRIQSSNRVERKPSNSQMSPTFRGSSLILNSLTMSLVDSLPSTPPFLPHRLDTSNKPDVSPGTHTPPIKTTTNTVPHLSQPQLQAAASIPSSPASGLNIPGAYPREKSGTSVGMSGPAVIQSAAETARSYLPTGLVSSSRT
jgi:hypothetical protein